MKKGNKVIGGFIWKFGERLISQGISFFISLVLARLLSPKDYGIIALVLIFISLASVFVTSGFNTSLIQKKDADETDFSTMFYCSLACSIILYLIIYICAPYIADFYNEPMVTNVLRVFALQVPFSVYNSIQNAYISRNLMFKQAFVASFISALISGVVGVTMAYYGFGVWALVCQSLTLLIANTVVLMFFVPWHPQMKFSFDSAKSLMNYGSKILLADLSGTFFNELRSIVIGKVYTSTDLAFYNKGKQLPYLITGNVNTAVQTVLFPTMAKESDNHLKIKQIAKKCNRILSYVSFPVMLGLAAVMSELIVFLFTEKWAECIIYGQLYCVGYLVAILGVVPIQAIKAIGKSGVVLKLEFIKKPVYFILLLIGMNINVFAIAITMVLYEFYGVAINMIQISKYLNYSFREQIKDILPACLLSVVMVILVSIVPNVNGIFLTLILKILVGAATYVTLSFVTKNDSFMFIKNLIFK